MLVNEVELLPDFSQAKRYRHLAVRGKRNPIADKIAAGDVKRIGSASGHTIYLDMHDRQGWSTNSRFYAIDDSTGLVDVTVDGSITKKGNAYTFKINTLDGRSGGNLKAYEFYRILMLKMPIILVTDQQSYGGMRTWQELSRYPDIDVYGWSKGKPVNIDPRNSDETHASEDDVWFGGSIEPEASEIMDMKLVAHRKIKHRGR